MSFIEPLVMRHNGVRLEPLSLEHEEGLRAAAADGALWQLRITSVPEPQDTRAYIEAALLPTDGLFFFGSRNRELVLIISEHSSPNSG